MTTTVAFIGLGVMGYPMAGHLANAGLSVRVWNRSGEKATQWASEHPGAACDSIALAVRDADFVMTCVGADKDLIEVFEGDEGIPGIGGYCRGKLEPGWCRQSFVGLRFGGAALGGGAPRDQLPR